MGLGMAPKKCVGSNNLNLLDPKGRFGTRLMGGKDSASLSEVDKQWMELYPIGLMTIATDHIPVFADDTTDFNLIVKDTASFGTAASVVGNDWGWG